MNGQKVVKVFCHEDKTIKDFETLNNELFNDAYKAHAYANILGPVIMNIGNILYVLCATVGGLFVLLNVKNLSISGLALDVSLVIPFLNMTKQFTGNINQVSQQINSIAMAMAGAERIFELIDQEAEVDDGYVTLVNAEITEGTIDLIAKGFYYKESTNTLWDSIMVEGEGEISVIVSNLLPQTTYVYKAFVTTENTVIEGEELSFTTEESSLAEIKETVGVNLYPNPAQEKAYLEVKGFEKGVKAVLSDLQGRILKEIEINTERMEIYLNSLSRGVYYLKVFDERSTQTIKIIKE